MSERSMRGFAQRVAGTKENGIICVSGMTGGQTACGAAEIFRSTGGQMLIVTASYERAQAVHDHLGFYAGEADIRIFPDEERSLFNYEVKSRALSFRRIQALGDVIKGRPGIYVATVMAAANGMCSPEEYGEKFIKLAVGDDIDFNETIRRISEMGYERVEMTELRGQFSVRGGIIDVFSPDMHDPFRIDLFDTEIDSLKTFDPMTQRSLESLQEISISPAVIPAPGEEGGASFLWDFFPGDAIMIADDWDRIFEQRSLADRDWSASEESESPAPGKREIFADMETLAEAMQKRRSVLTMAFRKQPKLVENLSDLTEVSCAESIVCNGRMDHYGEELKRLIKEGYEIHVVCSTEERMKNLRSFAERSEIEGPAPETNPFDFSAAFLAGPASGRESLIRYDMGYLPAGLYLPEDKLAYISDNDIFRNQKKRRRRKKSGDSRKIKAFTDLKQGDYVVHENHGIGRFMGIEPLVVEGIRKDYLKIRYAGSDMLYVPVEQMDLIQSYIGSGGDAPKVNKLSNEDWSKTKARAKAAIAEMAEELVRLSAERRMTDGYAFGADTAWQSDFESQFPYEETDNQLRCIEEIKQDMEMPWPMDRLLCGDVGFGKTEVAARAVFKCAMEGKQVAVLVPTTVLAYQHYHTFIERFKAFPMKIDMLCRFRSESRQSEIISEIARGDLDIVIGTHRMLSKDVKFKDLGLLVIDEEQRFGVQHKEAIKFLKKNVDVLTLTATPIPRTLHMSLSGIRSMSTLEEPPEERYPVQTYVMEQDDEMVREMINRELDRDGQVFVVFNRVRGINQVAEGLKHLVPKARICVAHGQMNENKLEDIMTAFMQHEYDILVATTIIESGIDIPNANTLIVMDADRFGLAQLYQLRGRVGRSNRPAYAYLMYQKNKVISEVAEKRLRAIKEFTEFGSGFRIAMKDLEIRGAGNILGNAQSGHMMQIGYELYCKLIDDAVRKLRGEKVADEELEVKLEIKTDAYISSDYISDEKLKLDMYKRIAEIKDGSDMSDVTDELLDRFGDVPPETESLMKVARIQAGCRKAWIKRVSVLTREQKVFFEFVPEGGTITPQVMAALTDKYGMKLLFNMTRQPSMKLPAEKNTGKLLDQVIDFLDTFNSAGTAV